MIIKEILPSRGERIKAYINLFNHSFVGINNDTIFRFDSVDNQLHDNAQVSERWTYVNNTSQDITVKDRVGIAFNISSTPSISSRQFVIRRTWRLRNASFSSLVKLLQSRQVFSAPELMALRSNLHHISKVNAAYMEFTIEYHITTEDIVGCGNHLYHFQSDKVLFLGDTPECPPHPYSQENQDLTGFGREEYFHFLPSVNHRVRYICHADNPRPRYIKVLNRVYTLMPEKLAPYRTTVAKAADGSWVSRPLGEYIQLVHSLHNDRKKTAVQSIIYTLEEAKKELGVYDSYELANNHGDLESSQKQKLLLAQQAVEELKLKTLREKEIAAQAADQRSCELARTNHEFDVFKLHANQEKARLEQQAIQLQADLQLLKSEQIKSEIALTNLLAEQKRLDAERKSRDDQLQREAKQQDEKLARMRDEHEASLKKLRDEHAEQVKREAAQLKDSYEARSLARKDASESIKILPTLIMAIGTIAAFFLGKSAKPA
jgi:hypothetical protein